MTDQILDTMHEYVPRQKLVKKRCSVPWYNERISQAVKRKHDAIGTATAAQEAAHCPEIMMKVRINFIFKSRKKLSRLGRGCKQWWSVSKQLLEMKGTSHNVPALKKDGSTWVYTGKDKAQLFADVFTQRYSVPELKMNEYSALPDPTASQGVINCSQITVKLCERVLKDLDGSSATGPDGVPARVLKYFAELLILSV